MSVIIAELLECTDERALVRKIREKPSKARLKYRLAERIISDALEGQQSAQRLIMQYLDGLPTQRIEASNELRNRVIVTHESAIDDGLVAMRQRVLASQRSPTASM